VARPPRDRPADAWLAPSAVKPSARLPEAAAPGDLEAISLAVFGDTAPEHIRRLSYNHAVMGTYTRGGTVFSAGTTDWSYGLDGHDPMVERITRNVLDRLLA